VPAGVGQTFLRHAVHGPVQLRPQSVDGFGGQLRVEIDRLTRLAEQVRLEGGTLEHTAADGALTLRARLPRPAR